MRGVITRLASAALAIVCLAGCGGGGGGGNGGPAGGDGAQFVQEVLPGFMQPGQSYNVSVTMKNTGSTAWSEDRLIRLGAQAPQDNTVWGTGRVKITGTVPPGQTYTFNFAVTPPSDSLGFQVPFQWEMVHDSVAWLGNPSTLILVIVTNTPTYTSAIEVHRNEGTAHVAQGTALTFETDPPTSGAHYPTATAPGFYTDAQPAGNLVHALEHSNVVIYYDPAVITPAQQDSLKAFAAAHTDPFAGIVVVPRTDVVHPLIATAWTLSMRLNSYNEAELKAFTLNRLGLGPGHTPHSE